MAATTSRSRMSPPQRGQSHIRTEMDEMVHHRGRSLPRTPPFPARAAAFEQGSVSGQRGQVARRRGAGALDAEPHLGPVPVADAPGRWSRSPPVGSTCTRTRPAATTSPRGTGAAARSRMRLGRPPTAAAAPPAGSRSALPGARKPWKRRARPPARPGSKPTSSPSKQCSPSISTGGSSPARRTRPSPRARTGPDENQRAVAPSMLAATHWNGNSRSEKSAPGSSPASIRRSGSSECRCVPERTSRAARPNSFC